MTSFPLENLRVINFGWVWAAPTLGQVLGDMGAQVIKIESRKRPDMVRVIPPLAQDQPLESLYGHCILRDHYCITLDLAHPKGHAFACDLVRSADVVIENFSPRVMRGYGLDYPAIRKLRPDVVMVSLTAAGQWGSAAQITTYGSIITCLSGMDSCQGYTGLDEPVPFGTAISDPLIGVWGAYAVLAALRHRARTGQGQHIDLSQWEAMAATVEGPFMDGVLNGRQQGYRANRDEVMAPHGAYPCRGEDAWVTIAVKTDWEWRQLCHAMGKASLADDPRFADGYRRLRHQDELDAILSEWTRGQDNLEVGKRLQALGIAAFPSMNGKGVYEDSHYAARGVFIEVPHHLGNEWIYGVPWKLSRTPGGVRRPAPSVGQDNQLIYSTVLGLSPSQIGDLEREKVLY